MFLFCSFISMYMILAKVAMADYGVNGLDLCLFRTFVSFITSVTIILIDKASLRVKREFWFALFIRSAVGTIGFTTFVFACKYLPLGIH